MRVLLCQGPCPAAEQPQEQTVARHFVSAYAQLCALLRGEADLRRVVRELLGDAAAAGAVYVEPQLCPPLLRQLGPDELVVEIVLDELRAATPASGAAAGVVLVAERSGPAQVVEQQARLAARYAGRGVVAFGLVGDERTGPPEPFAAAFRTARSAGLLAVPHAGELAGAGAVRATLDALQPDRLGHGIGAAGDPDLLARLAHDGTVLDVCPTSNVVIEAVRGLTQHPLPRLLAAGVTCSLGADDSTLFGAGLLDEYQLCRDVLGLPDSELARLAAGSLARTGAPVDVVSAARAGISRWLSAPP